MISLKIVPKNLLNIKSGIIVVPFFQDIIPSRGSISRIDWLMSNKISHLILSEKLSGNYMDRGLIFNSDKLITDKILLIGMGKSSTFDVKRILNISSSVINILSKIKVYDFSIELLGKEILCFEPYIIFEQMVRGFVKKTKEWDIVIHIAEEDDLIYKMLIETAVQIISDHKDCLTLA